MASRRASLVALSNEADYVAALAAYNQQEERGRMLTAEVESSLGFAKELCVERPTSRDRFVSSLFLGVLYDGAAQANEIASYVGWGYHGSMLLCTVSSGLSTQLSAASVAASVLTWHHDGIWDCGVLSRKRSVYAAKAMACLQSGRPPSSEAVPVDDCLPRCLAAAAMHVMHPRLALRVALDVCRATDASVETLDVVRYLVLLYLGLLQGAPRTVCMTHPYVPDGVGSEYWVSSPLCPAVDRVVRQLPQTLPIEVHMPAPNAHSITTMAIVWHLLATTDSILDATTNLAPFQHPNTAVAAVYGLLLGAALGTSDPRIYVRGTLVLEELIVTTLQYAYVAATLSPDVTTDAYRKVWTLYVSTMTACERLREKVQRTLAGTPTSSKTEVFASVAAFEDAVSLLLTDMDALHASLAPSPVVLPAPLPPVAPSVDVAVNLDAPVTNDALSKARGRLPQLGRRPSSRGVSPVAARGSSPVARGSSPVARGSSPAGRNKPRKPRQRVKPLQLLEEEALKTALRAVLVDRYATLRLSIKVHVQRVVEGPLFASLLAEFRRTAAIDAWATRVQAAKAIAANLQRSHVIDSKMMSQVRAHKELTPALQHIFYGELGPLNRLFMLFLDNSETIDSTY
ncbi:hypothetical protein SDRG_12362 [Saprolegnia diclina VS20]|uniref:Uncharacterized protein n=1 Tax=Saprolegnia diclina (strain VS20) TaxID=1156394 RepID=T0Q5D3_SAPDV|nr:hypothetical protein SDRG_12362 [Saprolegnia diclina VS20]EQC29816.1 hypothetical protein SDRG_12362 [Saprolegnia diclina VS20]|eukprot:XP_008616655.1 hypothetical protein SDRG_12362 [Saprolegnia diclina VS20]